MGISEFALHNVLRTYARQDRLGKVQKVRTAAAQTPPTPTDQVSLSSAGRKVQWVGQLAAEVVDRHHPVLDDDARSARVRTTQQELLERHRDEVGDDHVTPEAFEARLRPLYAS
ncbi:MAG: hypothetical protein P1P84_18400 [Deferrisomatales bacterium]|nr:hypothetical protein [Deferrisomatales bacterium]